MIKTKPSALSQAILLSTIFVSSAVHATAFLPQDPRALAMGGSSVSIANSSQAHYYNPSLLHNAREDEDFNWEIDATARVSDTDHLLTSMNDFGENDIIGDFSNDLASYTIAFDALFDITSPIDPQTRVTNFIAAQTNLRNSSTTLQTGIQDVTGKSISADVNVGTSFSIPNLETVSGALYFNAWTNFSIQGDLSEADDNTMTTLINLLNFQIPTDPAEALAQQAQIQQNVNDINNLDVENNLTSTIGMGGGVIQEFGISLASNFAISGYDFDAGITPKYMMITTTDFVMELNELTGENEPFDQEDTKDYTSFNADIGLSKQLNESWKTGFVIKNIIPQSFDTPSGRSKIKIDPSARIGASYQNNWASFAVDFDLTENDSIGGFSKTRFLTVGTELDVWLVKLRAGYRANLASDGGNVPSVGLGLYLFGLNADLAIAANQFELPETLEEASEFDDLSIAARIGIQW